MSVYETRLYQTPNLLQELSGTVTVTGPTPISASYPVTNLINYLDKRPCGNNRFPIIDAYGNKESYQTCYKTSNAELSTLNDTLVISFNLGSTYFLHAILIVADVYAEDEPSEHTNKNEWVQNYQLYIGDDPVYSNNPKCPGGPFMRTDDSSNYTKLANVGTDPKMWNYG